MHEPEAEVLNSFMIWIFFVSHLIFISENYSFLNGLSVPELSSPSPSLVHTKFQL